jgi:hypothetical protein
MDWQVTVGNELEALRAVIHVIHAVAFLGRSAGGDERSSLRPDPSSHGIGRGVDHKKCRERWGEEVSATAGNQTSTVKTGVLRQGCPTFSGRGLQSLVWAG